MHPSPLLYPRPGEESAQHAEDLPSALDDHCVETPVPDCHHGACHTFCIHSLHGAGAGQTLSTANGSAQLPSLQACSVMLDQPAIQTSPGTGPGPPSHTQHLFIHNLAENVCPGHRVCRCSPASEWRIRPRAGQHMPLHACMQPCVALVSLHRHVQGVMV